MKRILLMFALFAAMCAMSYGAPAPKKIAPPKPKMITRGFMLGQWKMEWNGTPCPLDLNVDGTQHHLYNGVSFSGKWEVKDGKLCIWETSTPNDPDSMQYWEVELTENCLEGKIKKGVYDGIAAKFSRPLPDF
jgi:hypothetical protein